MLLREFILQKVLLLYSTVLGSTDAFFFRRTVRIAYNHFFLLSLTGLPLLIVVITVGARYNYYGVYQEEDMTEYS